jgi:hypothetical protein
MPKRSPKKRMSAPNSDDFVCSGLRLGLAIMFWSDSVGLLLKGVAGTNAPAVW